MFQKRQIVVLSIILVVVVAGYLQYSVNEGTISAGSKSKNGDATYVDKKIPVSELNKTKPSQTVVNSEGSKEARDYFAQAKLNKEITRGKNKDALKEALASASTTKELKDVAREKLSKVVDVSEKEMKIETLVKEKGFKDVVALIGDDGSLDIVVKAQSLTSQQVAQITDIASRQSNIDILNIHVRSKF